MMVAMLLVISGDMSRHIRVASLLDMALWSTGSYRRADGDEGQKLMPHAQHLRGPFAHSCLEPMHPLLTATQCPTLSARVQLQC